MSEENILEIREDALGTLEGISGLEINNDANLKDIKKLLDDLVDYDNVKNTVLSDSEIDSFSKTSSNLLQYSIDEACDGKSELADELKEQLPEYLDMLGRSALTGAPKNYSKIVETDTYNIFAWKADSCELDKDEFVKPGKNFPEIDLSSKN